MTRAAVLLTLAAWPAWAASPGAPPQPPSAPPSAVGSPVTGLAAKTRVAANGGSYAVPASTAWLALVQPGVTAVQAIVLPASPADGQLLFVSTAGAIRSLSFSPAVPGWANGSALPANSGVTLGWDAGSNSWTRMQ